MLAGALLLAALPVQAHHSFAAEFDEKQPVGKVTNWGIEAGSPTTLLRRGLRKTDFPTGVEVVVEGYKSKSGAPRANGKTLTFADGRNFFLGASDNPSANEGK
jgi:hypothetical protein